MKLQQQNLIIIFFLFKFFSGGGNRRFGNNRDRVDRSSDFGNYSRRRNDDNYQNGIFFNVFQWTTRNHEKS